MQPIKFYQSLILPVMDYCDVAWSSSGKIERDKLDQAQRWAVKIVLNTNNSNAETDLKWLPLFTRRDVQKLGPPENRVASLSGDLSPSFPR